MPLGLVSGWCSPSLRLRQSAYGIGFWDSKLKLKIGTRAFALRNMLRMLQSKRLELREQAGRRLRGAAV